MGLLILYVLWSLFNFKLSNAPNTMKWSLILLVKIPDLQLSILIGILVYNIMLSSKVADGGLIRVGLCIRFYILNSERRFVKFSESIVSPDTSEIYTCHS